MDEETRNILTGWVIGIILIVSIILLGISVIWGGWSQAKTCQVELKRADWNRQIAVKEIKAFSYDSCHDTVYVFINY